MARTKQLVVVLGAQHADDPSSSRSQLGTASCRRLRKTSRMTTELMRLPPSSQLPPLLLPLLISACLICLLVPYSSDQPASSLVSRHDDRSEMESAGRSQDDALALAWPIVAAQSAGSWKIERQLTAAQPSTRTTASSRLTGLFLLPAGRVVSSAALHYASSAVKIITATARSTNSRPRAPPTLLPAPPAALFDARMLLADPALSETAADVERKAGGGGAVGMQENTAAGGDVDRKFSRSRSLQMRRASRMTAAMRNTRGSRSNDGKNLSAASSSAGRHLHHATGGSHYGSGTSSTASTSSRPAGLEEEGEKTAAAVAWKRRFPGFKIWGYPGDSPTLSPLEAIFARDSFKWEQHAVLQGGGEWHDEGQHEEDGGGPWEQDDEDSSGSSGSGSSGSGSSGSRLSGWECGHNAADDVDDFISPGLNKDTHQLREAVVYDDAIEAASTVEHSGGDDEAVEATSIVGLRPRRGLRESNRSGSAMAPSYASSPQPTPPPTPPPSLPSSPSPPSPLLPSSPSPPSYSSSSSSASTARRTQHASRRGKEGSLLQELLSAAVDAHAQRKAAARAAKSPKPPKAPKAAKPPKPAKSPPIPKPSRPPPVLAPSKRPPNPKPSKPPPSSKPPKSPPTGSSKRPPSPRPPPPPPAGSRGPSCVGQCCSNNPPKIADGMPTMKSAWPSTQLAHGAQIQIRSKAFGTWWSSTDKSSAWTVRIGAFNLTQPPSSQFFKVLRVSSKAVRLLTPGGTYVRASSAKWGIHFVVDTTSDRSDPRTVFTLVYKTGTPYVGFRASDGLFLSSEGHYLLRWTKKMMDWELFSTFEVMDIPAIRGVNLGGWLLYERWMNPNWPPKFDDVLDGTGYRFQSVATGRYISVPNGGGSKLSCFASSKNDTDQIFNIRIVAGGSPRFEWQLMTPLLQYWRVVPPSSSVWVNLVADDAPRDGSGNFVVLFSPDKSRVVFVAPSKNLLRANSDGSLTADLAADVDNSTIWSSSAAFQVEMVDRLTTDWQLARSLGSDAAAVMDEMRAAFINESDWAFMRSQAINAVRIPLGFWVADNSAADLGPIPRGTAAFLDEAFLLGKKYGIRIWFSVHAAPGSQGGSSGRDGLVKWGSFGNVNRTLKMVDWLASRYANDPMFLGMGLLNEPVIPGFKRVLGVEKDAMLNYYTKAYDIIRFYNPCVFVAMEGRVWSTTWEVHWHMWDVWHQNLIMETHLYTVFNKIFFANMTAEEEVQWVENESTKSIIDIQRFGRALLVGEFSNAMAKLPPIDSQVQRDFGRAQMQSYANARAGWFFWSLKLNASGSPHWSFYRSTSYGWLPKKPSGQWW